MQRLLVLIVLTQCGVVWGKPGSAVQANHASGRRVLQSALLSTGFTSDRGSYRHVLVQGGNRSLVPEDSSHSEDPLDEIVGDQTNTKGNREGALLPSANLNSSMPEATGNTTAQHGNVTSQTSPSSLSPSVVTSRTSSPSPAVSPEGLNSTSAEGMGQDMTEEEEEQPEKDKVEEWGEEEEEEEEEEELGKGEQDTGAGSPGSGATADSSPVREEEAPSGPAGSPKTTAGPGLLAPSQEPSPLPQSEVQTPSGGNTSLPTSMPTTGSSQVQDQSPSGGVNKGPVQGDQGPSPDATTTSSKDPSRLAPQHADPDHSQDSDRTMNPAIPPGASYFPDDLLNNSDLPDNGSEVGSFLSIAAVDPILMYSFGGMLVVVVALVSAAGAKKILGVRGGVRWAPGTHWWTWLRGPARSADVPYSSLSLYANQPAVRNTEPVAWDNWDDDDDGSWDDIEQGPTEGATEHSPRNHQSAHQHGHLHRETELTGWGSNRSGGTRGSGW